MIKLVILFLFVIMLFFLRKGLVPLAIGIVLAYILDPYVDWLEKKLRMNRLFCILIACLTLVTAVIFLILGFADIITGNLSNDSLVDAFQSIKAYYWQHKDAIDEYLPIKFDEASFGKLIQDIGGGAVKSFVGIIIGIYLLKDKAYFLRLVNQTLHLFLSQKTHGIVRELSFEINAVISAFVRGVFIDSVIVAFLSSLVLAALKINFAIFIGCFAGIANVIPYFGPIIGMVPAIVSALAEGSIAKAFFAAGALFLIQQIESNFIYPRIIGKSTGLHPLFVLVTVSIAGYYGGLFSMVLAVPIAGVIRVFICKWAYAQ